MKMELMQELEKRVKALHEIISKLGEESYEEEQPEEEKEEKQEEGKEEKEEAKRGEEKKKEVKYPEELKDVDEEYKKGQEKCDPLSMSGLKDKMDKVLSDPKAKEARKGFMIMIIKGKPKSDKED